MRIMSFSDLMSQMPETTSEGPSIDPEIQIIRLKEAAERFYRSNPFKRNDIITPASDSHYANAGVPHIVIDTRDVGYDFESSEPNSHEYGIRLDTRVIILHKDRIFPLWVDSSGYIYWEGVKNGVQT